MMRRLFGVTVLLLLSSFTEHDVIVTGPDLYGNCCVGSGCAFALPARSAIVAARALPLTDTFMRFSLEIEVMGWGAQARCDRSPLTLGGDRQACRGDE